VFCIFAGQYERAWGLPLTAVKTRYSPVCFGGQCWANNSSFAAYLLVGKTFAATTIVAFTGGS
jgi:hypothetical protein